MYFHEALDNYMNSHRISNYKMSKDTGISDSLIGYWRSGKRSPTLENLIIISDYLGVTIDSLIRGNNNNSKKLDISLNEDEDELLETYRKLDRRGRHRIHTIIYEEIDRMKAQKDTEVKIS